MKAVSRHEKFMRLAVEKAREGVRRGQTPFGACVVRAGKVISCAHNVVWKTGDITAHAEICAIRQACQKLGTVHLKDCVIYSTCEPCPMCFSACHWARIKKIYYGVSIRDARALGFNELSISNRRMKQYAKSPLDVEGGIARQENLAVFEEWRKARLRSY